MRRVSASTPPSIAPAPEPEEDAQPEWAVEEEAGEWTEALYDYTSEVCADAPPSLSLLASDGDADSLDLLRAVFAGGGRSTFTSGGEGTRDREDIARMVRTS
jgi:hypothetical protein